MTATRHPPRRFRDREHAGEVLASRLASHRRAPNTVVLALPRGGIVPAAVVARELALPLDVLISRKLRAPGNPELAIGALAEGAEPFLQDDLVASTGASWEYLSHEIAAQIRAIEARRRLFRGGRELELPHGATAIVVDDGIATGSTVIAAVHALRRLGAARVIVAAAVAPADTAEQLAELADEVVIPVVAREFRAVGSFYDRFDEVRDEEVRETLERAHGRRPGAERPSPGVSEACEVEIPADGSMLKGILEIPADAGGIVVFAHGGGSSRLSPRNRFVARHLHEAGLATLLVDLLTPEEAPRDDRSSAYRFDIDLLATRVGIVTDWLAAQPETCRLDVGYFGASTGAAAALVAAAAEPRRVHAIVSRGGRPDLAADALRAVAAPILLVVGGADEQVLDLNRQALGRLKCEKRLEIVPEATHLFEEPGALEEVTHLATEWFATHLHAAPRLRRMHVEHGREVC